jgi:hypothetical protein
MRGMGLKVKWREILGKEKNQTERLNFNTKHKYFTPSRTKAE